MLIVDKFLSGDDDLFAEELADKLLSMGADLIEHHVNGYVLSLTMINVTFERRWTYSVMTTDRTVLDCSIKPEEYTVALLNASTSLCHRIRSDKEAASSD